MTLNEKLAHIQQNLNAPKNQYNAYGNFNYRSCEDILTGVKPLLAETKTILRITDRIELIGERYYIQATAVLADLESEEVITTTAYAREALSAPKMDCAQITGSASSYARKYALNGLFCIDDTKDPDDRKNDDTGTTDKQNGTTDKKESKKKAKKEPKPTSAEEKKAQEEEKEIAKQKISDVKVKALTARCKEDRVDVKTILDLYKVKSLADLNEGQFSNIHSHWEDIVRL